MVQKLSLDTSRPEEAAAGIEEAEGDEGGEGDGPKKDEGGGREHPDDGPKRAGIGCLLAKGLPEESLAAEREADAEIAGVEAREDGELREGSIINS